MAIVNVTSTTAPALLHRAIILVLLIVAEIASNLLMAKAPRDERYFLVGIACAIVICFMMLRFRSNIGRDVLDICIYDLLLQIFGYCGYVNGIDSKFYFALAQSILILKVVRLGWGAHWPMETLTGYWPPFGILGLLGRRRRAAVMVLQPLDKVHVYFAIFGVFIICGVIHSIYRWFALPAMVATLLLILVVYGPKLLGQLEKDEIDRIVAQNALAQKSIELAQSNAELASKNTELAQLALKLQEKNDELDALCISRDETAKKLQDRNNVLREGNHDILPLTLWLTMNVQQALERASTDEQRAPLAEVVAVSKEVTAAISDIIKKAQIEFAWFAPPMHAVSTEILQHRLRQRLEPLATLRKIRLYGSNQQAVLHSNELVLMRILGNLIHNAITHCPPGSEVQLRFYPGENDCHIVVADNGRGIPDCAGRDRGANFVSLLQQARQHYRDSQDGIIRLNGDGIDDGAGYGIGLGSVTRLCDDIGTNMTLCSRPGVGSVFRFRVQLAQP